MSSKQKRHLRPEPQMSEFLVILKIKDISRRILGRGGSLRPYSRSYHMRSKPAQPDIPGNPTLSAINTSIFQSLTTFQTFAKGITRSMASLSCCVTCADPIRLSKLEDWAEGATCAPGVG